MSLSLAKLPDPFETIEQLRRENAELQRQLAESESAVQAERQQRLGLEKGAVELRSVLAPLYRALRHIHGELDAMGVGEGVNGSAAPGAAKSPVWEQWKQKLGRDGMAAKAIDILLLHGELNRTQLRIQLACATRTVADVVYKLNQAGLINKNGNKIALKVR